MKLKKERDRGRLTLIWSLDKIDDLASKALQLTKFEPAKTKEGMLTVLSCSDSLTSFFCSCVALARCHLKLPFKNGGEYCFARSRVCFSTSNSGKRMRLEFRSFQSRKRRRGGGRRRGRRREGNKLHRKWFTKNKVSGMFAERRGKLESGNEALTWKRERKRVTINIIISCKRHKTLK